MKSRTTRKLSSRTFLIYSLLLSLFFVSQAWAAPGQTKFVAGELLIQQKAGVAKGQIDKEVAALGAETLDEISQIRVKRIRVPEHALEKVKAALSRNPKIEFVEPNFIAEPGSVPNDSSYSNQWHLPKISAPQGWDINTGSTAVPIAIIDSGIDHNHPDLAGKIITGRNFLNGSTNTQDTHGHGTAVAGSAAASSNNSAGVAGVAWQNPIMPLQIYDTVTGASYSRLASAIIYAVDNGAKVINISLGGSSSSSTLQNAIDYAWNNGAVIFACAMNNSTTTPYYPAASNHVVAVASTDQNDNLSSFSNRGSWLDISAPGSAIYTTNKGGGYGAWNGTSFSSPITAGLAGLIWSVNPALTNADVVSIITGQADDLGAAGFDSLFGHGRINVYKSLLAAESMAPVADTQVPSVAITSPGDGDTLSGSSVINVAASDDTAVSKVELFIDGALYATDSSSPFSFSWNTGNAADGWHALSARAVDAAGNNAATGDLMVFVSNPSAPTDSEAPTVSFTAPGPSTSIGNRVVVSAEAFDNVGVSRIELYVDNELKKTYYSSSFSWRWNSRKEAKGAHQLTIKAFDALGNVGTDSITVFK